MPELPPLARPRGLRRPGHTRAARLVARAPSRARPGRGLVSEQDFRGCCRWLASGSSASGSDESVSTDAAHGSGSGAASAASGSGAATSGSAGASTAAVAQDFGLGGLVGLRGLVGARELGLGGGYPGLLHGLSAPQPRRARPTRSADRARAPGPRLVGRANHGCPAGAARCFVAGANHDCPAERARAPARPPVSSAEADQGCSAAAGSGSGSIASSAGADQDCSAGAASSAASGSETAWSGSDCANVVAASTVAAAQRS